MRPGWTKPKPWKPKDETYLRRFYAQLPLAHLAKTLRRTPISVRSRAKKLHLDKGRKHHWTAAEDSILRKAYANRATTEIAKRLGLKLHSVYRRAFRLGLEKSPEFLKRLRHQQGVDVGRYGAATQFPTGHAPANKGLRRPGYSIGRGRMQETQFKKGGVSRNYLPIGTIRADADGYLRQKIADGLGGFGNSQTWELIHRRNWIAAHGPVPRGHAVTFKDGNKQKPALENLELITRKELRRRNSIHAMYSPELKSTIFVAGWLKRRIRKALDAQKQNAGSARSPVRSNGAAKRRR